MSYTIKLMLSPDMLANFLSLLTSPIFFSQAAKYKAAILPVAGALLGGVLGGPIGLFAGAKLGGLAGVVGGGILGKDYHWSITH